MLHKLELLPFIYAMLCRLLFSSSDCQVIVHARSCLTFQKAFLGKIFYKFSKKVNYLFTFPDINFLPDLYQIIILIIFLFVLDIWKDLE